jgi:hypothetical protein
MTELVNFEITKTISICVEEFNKNLITELENKIKKDILGNILTSVMNQKSIFGFDDIKNFAKIEPTDIFPDKSEYYQQICWSGSGTYKKEFKPLEYPIIAVKN